MLFARAGGWFPQRLIVPVVPVLTRGERPREGLGAGKTRDRFSDH